MLFTYDNVPLYQRGCVKQTTHQYYSENNKYLSATLQIIIMLVSAIWIENYGDVDNK